MIPKKGTVGFRPDLVWIPHMNCKDNCPHCILKPSPITTDDEVREMMEAVKRHGLTTAVYIANQSEPNALKFAREDEFRLNKVVELKDSLEPPYDDVLRLHRMGALFLFSLHGHTEELHRLFSRGDGNFRKTVDSIRKAKELGLRTIVNCVFHRKNCRSVEAICDFVFQNGGGKIRLIKLSSAPRAANNMPGLFMEPDDIVAFFKIVNKVRQKYRAAPFGIEIQRQSFGTVLSWAEIQLARLQTRLTGRKQSYYCTCGREHVTIHPKTKLVYHCRFSITNERFAIGHWDDDKGIVIDRDTWFERLAEKIGEPCRSCKLLGSCGGGCRGSAIVEKQQRTGELDIYAGYDSCPVALGVRTPLSVYRPKQLFRKAVSCLLSL